MSCIPFVSGIIPALLCCTVMLHGKVFTSISVLRSFAPVPVKNYHNTGKVINYFCTIMLFTYTVLIFKPTHKRGQ
jgi:hypothetical protein